MQAILDAIAAEVLAPLNSPSPNPPGFGDDLDCGEDLTATFGEISGTDPLAVAQANYRRLRTSPGELVDDPDYGYDLDNLIQQPLFKENILQIPSKIEAQLRQDDRNGVVTATITPTSGTDFTLDVRAVSAAGPYSLTVALTDAGVLLQEMKAAQ